MPEGSNGVGFLIHAGSKADSVGKLKPHDSDRVMNRISADKGGKKVQVFSRSQARKGDLVGCFRIHAEQKFLG
jgi:hypothetical protein